MNHHARNNLTGAIENEKASVSWSGYGAVSSTVPVIPDLLHIAVLASWESWAVCFYGAEMYGDTELD
jgi:hypothetical protein